MLFIARNFIDEKAEAIPQSFFTTLKREGEQFDVKLNAGTDTYNESITIGDVKLLVEDQPQHLEYIQKSSSLKTYLDHGYLVAPLILNLKQCGNIFLNVNEETYSDAKAIIASVNHSGDSDSTGAVTGNIIGAIVGYSNIPSKLCLVKDEIENRMNMMQKAGIRELDKYQEIAEENRFPQIIIGINELFHLTDNRDKQNKEEEEYECLCLNLLKEFSRWGARFGVYFLFSFRYSCYPHLMRNLEHFTSSMYYWHYNGEIEYYDRDFESAVKNLQKNEILIQPNRTQNSFYECKMFGF